MILVTGGTGLVGAHLLLLLAEKGRKVRSLYRNPESIQKTQTLFKRHEKEALFSSIEWIQGDILDISSLEMAFESVEHVYHCAAFISFSPDDEKKLRKTNIEGTANIVNFCIARKVKKLCHVSSIAALGDLSSNERYLTETEEWNPEKLHSDYAISKYGAEMEVWRGQEEGLDVVMVNPGIILGAGFWEQGSGLFLANAKKGIRFYTLGTSGYVAVTDVVTIMNTLMESTIAGERFILVAENRTYKDIIDTIALMHNVSKFKIYIPLWLTLLFWRVDQLISLLFFTKRKLSKNGAYSLHSTDLFSSEKVIHQLGYKFIPINDYLKEVFKLK